MALILSLGLVASLAAAATSVHLPSCGVGVIIDGASTSERQTAEDVQRGEAEDTDETDDLDDVDDSDGLDEEAAAPPPALALWRDGEGRRPSWVHLLSSGARDAHRSDVLRPPIS